MATKKKKNGKLNDQVSVDHDILSYKGFAAKIHLNLKDKVLLGHIIGIEEEKTVEFRSDNITDFVAKFENEVDDYLGSGGKYKASFKGSFNVRISPQNHRLAVEQAALSGQKLSKFVGVAINRMLRNSP